MSDLEVHSQAELRDWLAANHATSGTQWLITWRQHTPHHLPWSEIVDELLCWGWIDSQPGKVDTDRTRLRISPRNPRSSWSGVNKTKIAALRAAGRMQPVGEAMVALAQANGMWDFLTDVEALLVPHDLATALGDHRIAWEGWPRTQKRASLEWIKTAKTAPTRAKRIADCAAAAREGRRLAAFTA